MARQYASHFLHQDLLLAEMCHCTVDMCVTSQQANLSLSTLLVTSIMTVLLGDNYIRSPLGN